MLIYLHAIASGSDIPGLPATDLKQETRFYDQPVARRTICVFTSLCLKVFAPHCGSWRNSYHIRNTGRDCMTSRAAFHFCYVAPDVLRVIAYSRDLSGKECFWKERYYRRLSQFFGPFKGIAGSCCCICCCHVCCRKGMMRNHK